jgi:hypothetical protein
MPSCKIGSVVPIKNVAGTGCQWERTENGMARIVRPVVASRNNAMYRKNRKNTRKNRKNTRKNRKNKKATRKNRK